MMSSNPFPSLDLIVPELARDEHIDAFFTLKNARSVNPDGEIPGLNIGRNTAEDEKQVRLNRKELFDYLDIDPNWLARGKQVHSNRVRTVTDGGLFPDTDGLVTAIPGLTLAIQVADCAAILMADKSSGVVGAIHAGWRGAAAGIISNAMDHMQRNGASVSNLEVYISPCISLKHFEVGEEVAEQFPDTFVDRESYKKPHVDLKQYVKHQLREHGVPEKQIETSKGCTVDDEDRFYSYRRERDKSGRMFAFIRIPQSHR